MKQVKRWQLNKTTFAEDDFLWLKKYSHHVDVKNDIQTFEVFGGRQFQVAGRRDVYVQTITEEQENMLHLKYGSQLWLLSTMMINENQIYQDEYGTITFNR